MAMKKSRKKKPASATGLRTIKKYPNRRLYDTARRAYITLEDIKQYVLDHLAFRVIDANTEADLTKATLFQVLTEHETSHNAFFTTELLQHLIRLYHDNMQTIFGHYFENALAQFIKQKEIWSQHFEKTPVQPLSTASASFVNPFAAINEFTRQQSHYWENLLKKPREKE